jgi:ADP-heptose:LPS heptosyltransferase
MNGKQARALRREALSGFASAVSKRKRYQALKREFLSENGQHAKPVKVRKHKPKAAIKATWPKTKDQKQQSRPMIVVHPIRQIVKLRKHYPTNELVGLAKHHLDAIALSLA